MIGEVKYELRKSETNYKRCFLSFDQHMVVTHVKNEINELIDEKLLVIANYTDSCLVTKSFELIRNHKNSLNKIIRNHRKSYKII